MEQEQQNTAQSFERVQGYLDAHPDVFGALANAAGRVQLDTAVTEIQAQSNAQGAAVRNTSANVATKDSAIQSLRLSHMQPIAQFARTQLDGAPGYAALTDSGLRRRGAALVEAARAMGTAAAPYESQLVAAQFPADVLAQLATAADAVAQAISDKADTTRQKVEATAGIREQVALGKQAVAMLNPVVNKMIVGNPALAAGWRSAKHVTRARRGRAPVVAPVVTESAAQIVPSGASNTEVKTA